MSAFVWGSGLSNYISAVRVDISDDTVGSYTYTDIQIIEIFKKSMLELNLLIGSTFEYHPSNSGISPTPTSDQSALLVALVECKINKRARSSAVSKGIKVKSGEESIDTTAAFAGYKELINESCGYFKDLLREYLSKAGGAATYGKLIWHGEQRLYEDERHDGQGSHIRYYDSPFDPS